MTRWENLRWAAIGALGRRLLAAWFGSCRIETLGLEGYEKARQDGRPVIFLVWHGRILVVPYFFRKRDVAALVSPSHDGEFLARIGEKWDYQVIRGSSSHPVMRAWSEMKDILQRGGELIIIPDGPRGPDRKFKSGAIKLARDTGALLVPFSFSASRKRFLKSWDKFLLAYPFSKVTAIYGELVSVPADADEEVLEILRKGVEQALIALDAEADACFEPDRSSSG